jgi:hypothetical protein
VVASRRAWAEGEGRITPENFPTIGWAQEERVSTDFSHKRAFPDGSRIMVIQVTELTAVQVQPAAVETSKDPVPPTLGKLWPAELIE